MYILKLHVFRIVPLLFIVCSTNSWEDEESSSTSSKTKCKYYFIYPLTHSSIYPLNVIFFSFKKPKHDEENGDKEGSWKPPSGVNTTSVGQLANVLKQGIPTQLKSTKVCMYMYMYTCICTSRTHTWTCTNKTINFELSGIRSLHVWDFFRVLLSVLQLCYFNIIGGT